VIEETQTVLHAKVFEAPTLDAAKHLADQDQEWDTWAEWDSHSTEEIREDQCAEVREDS